MHKINTIVSKTKESKILKPGSRVKFGVCKEAYE